MNLPRVLVLAIVCAAPLAASAQWQWIDKSGRKVFSDQAPPPDIPAKDILRQPGGRPLPATPSPVASAAATPASAASGPARAAASAPRVSGTDKELEAKRKQTEAAEAEKARAEAEREAKTKAEACERARTGKLAFDTNQRVARMNAKGEREILDDAARTAEARRLDGVIANTCK